MYSMSAATSTVENSAQVPACWLKFVHEGACKVWSTLHAPLVQAQSLLANVRLVRRNLPGINTVAYFAAASVTKILHLTTFIPEDTVLKKLYL